MFNELNSLILDVFVTFISGPITITDRYLFVVVDTGLIASNNV